METARDKIKKAVEGAMIAAKQADGWSGLVVLPIIIEEPTGSEHGDYAVSVALKLAGIIKKSPLEIARRLADVIALDSGDFAEVAVASPGFINFCLSPDFLRRETAGIFAAGSEYGKIDIGRGQKVQVEFISANPTGSLTLGNGRGGFYGDVLANVLAAAGFAVRRAYFINDAGHQVEILGHSVLGDEKAQYRGDYIEKLRIVLSDDLILPAKEVGFLAANRVLNEMIKPTIAERMKIEFDEWISEKEVRDSGATERMLARLKEKGLVYEQDGAVWFKSTAFGDDKDRVLITAARDGRESAATYLLPDIAYHYKKFTEDKFDKVINIWGADHHGYIARLQAAGKALAAWDEKNLKIVIMQLVRLFVDGQEVKMSKRAGTYITLDELLAEIPLDVARWFFLSRSPETQMDFDLNLAKEQSDKNPVYYAQYAYVRIRGILAKSLLSATAGRLADFSLLDHSSELNLMRRLIKLPEIIAAVAEDYQIHRLPQYALETVRDFHKFYEDCRVLDENNENLTRARLGLCVATEIVLKNIFNLMGISAPEKM